MCNESEPWLHSYLHTAALNSVWKSDHLFWKFTETVDFLRSNRDRPSDKLLWRSTAGMFYRSIDYISHVLQETIDSVWKWQVVWKKKKGLKVIGHISPSHSQLSPKPVRRRTKTSFPSRKAFSVVLCSSCNEEMLIKLKLLQHPHKHLHQLPLFYEPAAASRFCHKKSEKLLPSSQRTLIGPVIFWANTNHLRDFRLEISAVQLPWKVTSKHKATGTNTHQ